MQQRAGIADAATLLAQAGQRLAERDAAGRVIAAHHAVHVVTTGIQAWNGQTLRVDHLGMLVDAQTGKCAQAARDDLNGIERPMLDGRHTRVAQTACADPYCIALDAVVRSFAFAKVGVFA